MWLTGRSRKFSWTFYLWNICISEVPALFGCLVAPSYSTVRYYMFCTALYLCQDDRFLWAPGEGGPIFFFLVHCGSYLQNRKLPAALSDCYMEGLTLSVFSLIFFNIHFALCWMTFWLSRNQLELYVEGPLYFKTLFSNLVYKVA